MQNYCHKTVIDLKIFASTSILSPRKMFIYEREFLKDGGKFKMRIKTLRVSVIQTCIKWSHRALQFMKK